jgi:hypothetical protein
VRYGRRRVRSSARAARLDATSRFDSYRAALAREGAAGAEDVALIGDETVVSKQLEELARLGATEFIAMELARGAEEVRRTRALLREIALDGKSS